jgi:hypothetical protein
MSATVGPGRARRNALRVELASSRRRTFAILPRDDSAAPRASYARPDVSTVSVRYIVDDVDAAIAFYTAQLGFQEVMHCST